MGVRTVDSPSGYGVLLVRERECPRLVDDFLRGRYSPFGRSIGAWKCTALPKAVLRSSVPPHEFSVSKK